MADMNEIEAAAHEAKRVREAAEAAPAPRTARWPIVAIGVGVGSAALAAALLYANQPSRKKK